MDDGVKKDPTASRHRAIQGRSQRCSWARRDRSSLRVLTGSSEPWGEVVTVPLGEPPAAPRDACGRQLIQYCVQMCAKQNPGTPFFAIRPTNFCSAFERTLLQAPSAYKVTSVELIDGSETESLCHLAATICEKGIAEKMAAKLTDTVRIFRQEELGPEVSQCMQPGEILLAHQITAGTDHYGIVLTLIPEDRVHDADGEIMETLKDLAEHASLSQNRLRSGSVQGALVAH